MSQGVTFVRIRKQENVSTSSSNKQVRNEKGECWYCCLEPGGHDPEKRTDAGNKSFASGHSSVRQSDCGAVLAGLVAGSETILPLRC